MMGAAKASTGLPGVSVQASAIQFLLDLERQIALTKIHVRAAGVLHDEEATLQL
jgi:hypothetical protein